MLLVVKVLLGVLLLAAKMLAADSEAQELFDEPQVSQTDDLIAAVLILLSGFAVRSSGAASLGATRFFAAARNHFGLRASSVRDIP
eukprot:2224321-Prymnesium_polylepis.1